MSATSLRSAGQGCRSVQARQFDFWVGSWTIANTGDGSFGGANAISTALGGCGVEERFVGANGARGRSLSIFDTRTRRWYQNFVGVFAGNFRISGTGTDAVAMHMTGTRAAFSGPNPTRITWTTNSAGQVRQLIENSFDGGATFVPGFDGTYSRASIPLTPPPLLPGICPRIGAFRRFDFALGDWDVVDDRGREIGSSQIRTDLDQCLVEERFSSGEGVESISFLFFDLGAGQWVRAYGDRHGRYLELVGDAAPDGTFLFSGARPGSDSRHTVVNVWRSTSNGLEQRLEGFPGPGSPGVILHYRPRVVPVGD